jgi:hypothetical protein
VLQDVSKFMEVFLAFEKAKSKSLQGKHVVDVCDSDDEDDSTGFGAVEEEDDAEDD